MQSDKETYLFSKEFSTKKNSDLKFIILPLTEDMLENVSKEIGHVFANYDSIDMYVGNTEEELTYFSYLLAEDCLKQNSGVVCFEKNSGDFVGAALCGDVFERDSQIFTKSYEKYPEFEQKMETLEIAFRKLSRKTNKHYFANKPMDRYSIRHICTAKKYQGLGIMSEMIKYIVEEHPIMKNASSFVCLADNTGTETALKRAGFEICESVDYDQMIVNGKFFFEGLEKFQRDNGLKRADKLMFMTLLKENLNSTYNL